MKRLIVLALVLLASQAIAGPRLPRGATDKVFPGRNIKPPLKPTVDLAAMQPKHWDFEDGTLQGFIAEDLSGSTSSPVATAFSNQPTFGDNVSAKRALDTSAVRLPANPCDGLVLDEATTCEFGKGVVYTYLKRLQHDLSRLRSDLDAVGGGYWNTPFPIGKQGLYWLGSAENRPKSGAPRPWGTMAGDRATGRLVSPILDLQHKYLHLLVGGGCTNEVGVYLQAKQPRITRDATPVPAGGGPIQPLPQPRPGGGTPTFDWVTLKDATGAKIEARGACMENMVRVVFDISNLKGTKARILIEDKATGAFGHVNVDDIWLTNDLPLPSARDRDPVWAVADLHAHLMNEKGFIAFNAQGNTPEARGLWGSALGPIENLRRCNDTHTTNNWNFNSHQDEVLGSTYTLCRDVCLNLLDGAGLPERVGDQLYQDGVFGGYHDTHGGFPSFTAWPMWWSATHQQMHWTWVRRAYQGGVRLMVAAVGNSEVISFALSKEQDRPFMSDQDALAMQIPAIKEFARQNSTWAEVAYTPRDARRIINSGKLAIIIGVELDHVMDSCAADVRRQNHHRATTSSEPNVWISQNGYDVDLASALVGIAELLASARIKHVTAHPDRCTDSQIEARIDALYQEGVRQILPMHFSDNLLGGYAITGDLFIASAIFGNAGAHPPQLMSQADLEHNFGDRARPFVPVAREATYGENARRKLEWQRNLPIGFELEGISLPLWVRLGAGALLDGSLLPPGVGRSLLEFFAGQCIQDDGWRIVAAIFSAGASEAACGITSLTDEIVDAARSTMPWEGALDSAAMIPLGLTAAMHERSFHVNARGLQPAGETFIRQMMRRGMLIDIQHSSEMTKRGILNITQAYPVMASHGGAQIGVQRNNENTLSSTQLGAVYAPPGGFTPGIVGIGTQSTHRFTEQLRNAASGGATDMAGLVKLQSRGVALGTDLNGIDWHAPPRFGKFAYYPGDLVFDPPDPIRERNERQQHHMAGGIGPKVAYDAYSTATNPWASTLPSCAPDRTCASWSSSSRGEPLHPLQISSGGVVTRTFDINYDGLAHYGMLPDFMQEMSLLGATPEELGALFRSAEGTIKMWEEGCFLAYQNASRPRSLIRGCGPADLYR